jgi:hypothetical protein
VSSARQAIPLIPDDNERQALRLRRYLLAAATSLLRAPRLARVEV